MTSVDVVSVADAVVNGGFNGVDVVATVDDVGVTATVTKLMLSPLLILLPLCYVNDITCTVFLLLPFLLLILLVMLLLLMLLMLLNLLLQFL